VRTFHQGRTRCWEKQARQARRNTAFQQVLFVSQRHQPLGAESLGLWEEIWPGPAMKVASPLAFRSPGLRLALALKIKRHRSADEILQGRLIDLVAFVDVDGAPDIPLEAGVE